MSIHSKFNNTILNNSITKNQVLNISNNSRHNDETINEVQYVRFHFIATSCNAEISMKFIGSWIPILREMLVILAKAQNRKKEFIMNNLIQNSDVEDKVFIIE